MDRFMCGALFAVARKCRRLAEELKRLHDALPDNDDYSPARDLAARQIMCMEREAREAQGHAENLLRISEDGAVDGAEHVRNRALSRYRRFVAFGKFAEYYVVPFVRGYDAYAVQLTKLCQEIAAAVAWPHDEAPIVSCGASNYFHFIAEERDELVLAPALAGTTVLPFPDLVHEMAHGLMQNPSKRSSILGVWNESEYVKSRVTDALGDDRFAIAAARHWVEHGVEEIACDTIAAFVAGPSYAWQHVRACWGREEGQSVYDDGDFHPPDSGRFAVICTALAVVGGQEELEALLEAWDGVIADEEGAERTDFYPESLMVELAREVLRGCVKIGLRPFPDQLPSDDPRCCFSDGWKQMRCDPRGFDEAEAAR